MRNISNRVLLVSLLLIPMAPAKAFLGVGDVVTDPMLTGKVIAAEAVRYGQAVQELQQQVSMYQNMIYNTVTLANPVLQPIGALARTVANTYYQGQSLMYRAQNVDQAFGSMYPSYMNYQSYLMNVGRGGQTMEQKYKDWSDKGYDNVRTALQAANIQADNQAKDSEMLEKLVQQANSTGGQVQALQGMSQLLGNQSRQAAGLNELVLTQIRMQASYYGLQIERQSAFDAAAQGFRTPQPMNTKGQGH